MKRTTTKTKQPITAIILAGGSGTRMKNTALPKQFVRLCGKPLYMHSLETYSKIRAVNEIILVINKSFRERHLKDLKKYPIRKISHIVDGGRHRHGSIQNAMQHLTHNGLVVIHNAANPTTSPSLIKQCLQAAQTKPAVTAFIPAIHTVFIHNKTTIRTPLEREHLGYAADPQVFKASLLRKALELCKCSNKDQVPMLNLVHRLGKSIAIVNSSKDNFKVTYKNDLRTAKNIMEKQ